MQDLFSFTNKEMQIAKQNKGKHQCSDLLSGAEVDNTVAFLTIISRSHKK